MKRIYLQLKVTDLTEIVLKNKQNKNILNNVYHELQYRTTQSSQDLKKAVEKLLGLTKTSPVRETIYKGTGFIISSDGYVLTNYHVVEGAEEIKIISTNGEEKSALSIKEDASNDIAVLKLNEAPVNIETNLHLADSSKVEMGDKVFTLGYPYSEVLGKQVRYTEGTISSLCGVRDDPRKFQISVPIQPGNSGGPLFNKECEVIGIVSSSLEGEITQQRIKIRLQNVNFAIKSAYIKKLLSNLPDIGSVLVQPTDSSFKPKRFIERVKNNIVLIKAKL